MKRVELKDDSHQLSWTETAEEIAAADEIWDQWDATLGDRLEIIPWDEKKKLRYRKKPR